MKNHITIRFGYVPPPPPQNSQVITHAEFSLVWNLCNPQTRDTPRRITAIKFIREQYGLGLKEAKDLCDVVAGSPSAAAADSLTAPYTTPFDWSTR